MWLNPHILVKWYLFKCQSLGWQKNIQRAKRRFDRRIGQLYDDLRRADFQGDKDAVASWTEEVLGLQRFSKKGTVFNDETRRGVEILKDVFSQTYDVSCSFLVFSIWTLRVSYFWSATFRNHIFIRYFLTVFRFKTCMSSWFLACWPADFRGQIPNTGSEVGRHMALWDG